MKYVSTALMLAKELFALCIITSRKKVLIAGLRWPGF